MRNEQIIISKNIQGSVIPIKTNLLLSISFFSCATACADRYTSGINSLIEINL